MYKIDLPGGYVMWMNERIIMKIMPNKDGTFTLYHFNGNEMIILGFSKI